MCIRDRRYTRSLVNLGIGLYTSRLTLDALGIADYGIYNVVGSLVALFGLFNGCLLYTSRCV